MTRITKQVAPAQTTQTTQSPPSPVRQSTRSPNRGLRQSPTPRQWIKLEKTNSKNRFSALEDEESMECGAPPSAPSSPTPEHCGKSHRLLNKSTLLKLYKSLVRSKLDYGCFIYGSARKSYLRCLDSIHHLGLRRALGALQTSPVESLYVEANEAPLSLRWEELALQYFTKLQSCPSNPAFKCTINPKYKELFARKESAIPSFGIRMQSQRASDVGTTLKCS